MVPPIDDAVLEQMLEVTAAINDAPMGELSYEDEVFDLQRMRDTETAEVGWGERSYRVVARHRETGGARRAHRAPGASGSAAVRRPAGHRGRP